MKNKVLLKPELIKKFPEIEIFLGSNFKYTTNAYGWNDDTLLMYQEENFKNMFYMCKDKDLLVPYNRRFIYYIKAQSFTKEFLFNYNLDKKAIIGSARNSKLKIPLKDLRVIKFKNPFIELVNKSQMTKIRNELDSVINKIDNIILKIV